VQRFSPGVQATQPPSRHTLVSPVQLAAAHAPWLEHSSRIVVEPGRQRVESGLHTPTHFPAAQIPAQS
jgi:hypothetical protein